MSHLLIELYANWSYPWFIVFECLGQEKQQLIDTKNFSKTTNPIYTRTSNVCLTKLIGIFLFDTGSKRANPRNTVFSTTSDNHGNYSPYSFGTTQVVFSFQIWILLPTTFTVYIIQCCLVWFTNYRGNTTKTRRDLGLKLFRESHHAMQCTKY